MFPSITLIAYVRHNRQANVTTRLTAISMEQNIHAFNIYLGVFYTTLKSFCMKDQKKLIGPGTPTRDFSVCLLFG